MFATLAYCIMLGVKVSERILIVHFFAKLGCDFKRSNLQIIEMLHAVCICYANNVFKAQTEKEHLKAAY